MSVTFPCRAGGKLIAELPASHPVSRGANAEMHLAGTTHIGLTEAAGVLPVGTAPK
jgi:hypothetical protein